MAIATTMSSNCDKDAHEHDLVMPGFRFHPTEEELIEFYLRRKVEGKRFNIELITFLDLYRYDPWDLPALAAIGEKEWFFYVPRDKKYRNGDRPNRVTTSGYWKATGADRMIRGENLRSIGLKKTLVFYSGKAPKGIRTSWIMNEYRLPQNETDRTQKTEISLCRVYKRSGVDDQCHILPSSKQFSSKRTRSDKRSEGSHRPTSSSRTPAGDASSSEVEKMGEVGGCSSTNGMVITSPVSHEVAVYGAKATLVPSSPSVLMADGTQLDHSESGSILVPSCTLLPCAAAVDELNKIVGFHQNSLNQPNQFFQLPLQTQLLPLNALPNSSLNISDKLWEWNPLPEARRD